jgi:hypothetical protein
MRIRTVLMLVLSALALVLVLVLSACGASSVKSSVDPVAVAAEKTVTAQTVHVSMTMSEEASSLPAPFTIAADGVEDFANRRAAMNMDMSALASLTGGRLGSPDDWKIETVMDGLTIYMHAPFFQTALKLDKPWVKIDMENVGKQAGLNLSSLMSYDPTQWTQYLDYLRGSEGAVVMGHELVRGVLTMHYEASVDFDAYLNSLSGERRSAAKAALDKLNELGKPQYGPFEVWVDAQGRIRQETFDYSIDSGNSSVGSVKTSFKLEFYDYDVPVSITIPSPDQVVDLMQVAGSLGNG